MWNQGHDSDRNAINGTLRNAYLIFIYSIIPYRRQTFNSCDLIFSNLRYLNILFPTNFDIRIIDWL